MVRVIDPTPDPSVVRTHICQCCGVKLAYTKADVRNGIDSDYTGGRDTYTYIVCPSCNERQRVSAWPNW